MDRNIFSKIQIPGASPTDANWECARWGFHTWEELFNNMFSDSIEWHNDDENSALNSTMEELENDVNSILNGTKHKLISYEILNEPLLKKKCIDGSEKVEEAPKPSTSANFKSVLNDSYDELLANCTEEASKKKNETPKPAKTATKAEIQHKRNLAIIRRKDRFDADRFKNKLDDLFWGVHLWPPLILSILLSPDFGYLDRLSLATFFFGNGLENPGIAVQIFKFYNNHWNDYRDWNVRFLKFEKLFEYLAKAHNYNDPDCQRIRFKYYFYSMIADQTMFFDGDVRGPSGQRIKYERKY